MDESWLGAVHAGLRPSLVVAKHHCAFTRLGKTCFSLEHETDLEEPWYHVCKLLAYNNFFINSSMKNVRRYVEIRYLPFSTRQSFRG
jgi:hypothetical protein